MTRTFSTITWGAALIVSALVLNWQQSIPWAIASAGVVPVIVGVAKGLMDSEKADAIKRAAARETLTKQTAQSKALGFDQDKGDAF